ncbi:hypothetical protein [Desulfonema ishimotonii]|nr:hypothetical protein [Desulfonema ishimotonii]
MFWVKKHNSSPGPECHIAKGDFLYPPAGKVKEDTYRTRDGCACFDFRFEEFEYHYEIYVLSTPFSAYGVEKCPLSEWTLADSRINPSALGHNMAIRTYHQARTMAAIWSEHVWANTGPGEIQRLSCLQKHTE